MRLFFSPLGCIKIENIGRNPSYNELFRTSPNKGLLADCRLRKLEGIRERESCEIQSLFLSNPPPCHQIGSRQGRGHDKIGGGLSDLNIFHNFGYLPPKKGALLESSDSKLPSDQVRQIFCVVLRYPLGPTLRGAVFRRPKRRGGRT